MLVAHNVTNFEKIQLRAFSLEKPPIGLIFRPVLPKRSPSQANTYHNYHNSRHYQPSCPLFETRCFGDWICLRLQVVSTQLGPIDKTNPCLCIKQVPPEDGDRIQSPKRCFK
jgi:hypothetical protein